MSTASTTAVLVAALTCIAQPALAQQADGFAQQRALIGDAAVSNSSGRIAVNQASGVGNVQANLAAIAVATDGLSLADVSAFQQAAPGSRLLDAHASIDGTAFSNSTGAMSVNQAAGASNLQLNVIAIGSIGAVEVARASDAALANTTSAGTSTEGTVTVVTERRAAIDLDAFRGSQGVVQVNQTAGVGNLSTNAIVLQLPGGAP